MDKGEAIVRGTIGGFLLVGFSLQSLWFESANTKKTILPCRSRADAFRCNSCDVTVIDGDTHLSQKYMDIGKTLGRKYAQWKRK